MRGGAWAVYNLLGGTNVKRFTVAILLAAALLTAGCAKREKAEPAPDLARAVSAWQYFTQNYDELPEELTDSFGGVRLADGFLYVYYVGSCEKYEDIFADYEDVVQYVEVSCTLHYLEALKDSLYRQFPENKGYRFLVSVRDNRVIAHVPMSEREFSSRLKAFGFGGEPVTVYGDGKEYASAA